MLFVAVALYFLLACFVAWLALFPAGRDFLARRLSIVGRCIDDGFHRWKRLGTSRFAAFRQTMRETAIRGGAAAKQHSWLIGGAIALLCLPPLFALLAGGRPMLDGFDLSSRETNEQIAELLKGEQLVPPPPLPPILFTTEEVAQERPMLASASRNWQLLNPDFAQRLLRIFKIMKEQHGYDMVILEGYRSPERQNMLAAMGAHVTNAAAFQSYHQFGLAADCAFLRDGKLVISEKDPWAMRGYRLYGEVSESLGLHWGGRWKMMDFGHTEWRVSGMIKK